MTTTYRCPKCDGTDLRVELPTVYVVDAHGIPARIPGLIPTASDIPDDALMRCAAEACEHDGPASHFHERWPDTAIGLLRELWDDRDVFRGRLTGHRMCRIRKVLGDS